MEFSLNVGCNHVWFYGIALENPVHWHWSYCSLALSSWYNFYKKKISIDDDIYKSSITLFWFPFKWYVYNLIIIIYMIVLQNYDIYCMFYAALIYKI